VRGYQASSQWKATNPEAYTSQRKPARVAELDGIRAIAIFNGDFRESV